MGKAGVFDLVLLYICTSAVVVFFFKGKSLRILSLACNCLLLN